MQGCTLESKMKKKEIKIRYKIGSSGFLSHSCFGSLHRLTCEPKFVSVTFTDLGGCFPSKTFSFSIPHGKLKETLLACFLRDVIHGKPEMTAGEWCFVFCFFVLFFFPMGHYCSEWNDCPRNGVIAGIPPRANLPFHRRSDLTGHCLKCHSACFSTNVRDKAI